MEKGHFIWNKK